MPIATYDSGMANQPLGNFIEDNRAEILRRCRDKVAERLKPRQTDAAEDSGVAGFLDDLICELGDGASKIAEMKRSATRHGADLFARGFTIGQVVQDYGGVCQSVTELALEENASIDTDDFRVLNKCLDDAIAMAVSEYARHQQRPMDTYPVTQTMTAYNLAQTALHGFEALQSGAVGITGATAEVVHRSLVALRDLIQTENRKHVLHSTASRRAACQ